MKLLALRPILWTKDFDETLDFYTVILDFSIENKNDDWGWASLKKDDIEIMIAKPNQQVYFDKPVFTGSFYFITDKIDELWEQLKDKVQIGYEIETFKWEMREFAIFDNNGYLLQFGQDLSK